MYLIVPIWKVLLNALIPEKRPLSLLQRVIFSANNIFETETNMQKSSKYCSSYQQNIKTKQ